MIKFFKWALKKAGLSADQLMAIINKGKAVIKKIVTDPIGFIGNLVKAVKDGICLFVTNIKKHLITGLISWLTGAMADVPIQLPEKWDLKGIMHLILQILGFTWDRIRTKLVKRLGERVVAIAETSIDIVKRLITEGPMALWEMIKAKAAEIKQKVMDGIRNWVIVQVVKQAVLKLVSFLNPAGAIVQAVLAIYNVIMFFVQNIQRIIQFVKSVFESVGDIAMGKLSAAAQAVERAMAMTIPIILGFLARLIGLSGIGKAVSKVITKVRKPIDKVVDKVVDKIAQFAKKLTGKAKAKKGAGKLKDKVVRWWTKKVRFKDKDGARHSVFIEMKGKRPNVMVASSKAQILKYLKSKETEFPKEVTQARKVYDVESKYLFSAAPNKDPGRVAKALQRISQALTKIGGDFDESLLPTKAEVEWSPGRGTARRAKPRTVKVERLTAKTVGNFGGSSPPKGRDTGVTGWSKLHDAGLTFQHPRPSPHRTGNWLQMHLINEKIGGEGKPYNLVPGPQHINSGFMRSFEQTVKSLVSSDTDNKKNVVLVSSKVSYHRGPLAPFASSVKMGAGLFAYQGKKSNRKKMWAKINTASLQADVPLPEPELAPSAAVISLNFASGTTMKQAFPDIDGPVMKKSGGAQIVVDAIKNNRPYGSSGDFTTKVAAHLAKRRDADSEGAIKARLQSNIAAHLNAEFTANGKKFGSSQGSVQLWPV